jgi:3-oxosteroid 1-dehydrogenase
MGEAWWAPVAELPSGVNRMNRSMVNADRTRPRSILVNRKGYRFTNEAASYNALGGALHREDSEQFRLENLPCWLIFDDEYLRRYGSVGMPTDGTAEWLTGAETIEALATKLSIPHEELSETVRIWNQNVDAGCDPEFHRGESAHDLWWGDPEKKGMIEGTLGRIDTPPFYAVSVSIGALGTKGGPKVDQHARVIDVRGTPFGGLYAVGNVSSPTGMIYAGAGGTLGPGMTFAYLAGKHIAETAYTPVLSERQLD